MRWQNLRGLVVVSVIFAFLFSGLLTAAELSVDDFDFDRILGSDGATLEQLGPNHFKIHLARAPGHPEWSNMCQFVIKQNAKGNALRLDGVGSGIRQFCSWSYNRQTWHPIRREKNSLRP